MKPKIISPSRIVYRCPYFMVSETDLQLLNGKKHTYYEERGIDFVSIIVEQNDKLLLVNQYRYPIDSFTLENAAGGIEADESIEHAARRELLEETGYLANTLQYLGAINPLTARSCTLGHVFLATEIEDTGKLNLDDSEYGLSRMWMDIPSFKKSIRENRIRDAVTLSSWALYLESR